MDTGPLISGIEMLKQLITEGSVKYNDMCATCEQQIIHMQAMVKVELI